MVTMSILNTSSATNYLLDIPDYGLSETIQMQVQSYTPPVIEIPMVKVPSGLHGKSVSMMAGTAFIYKPIRLSILVDENFSSWLEIVQWAMAIENYKKVTNESFDNVSGVNAHVHILDNHKKETVLIHQFTDPFPHLIYPPTFNHSAGSDYPMIMNVEIGYNTLNILDKNGDLIQPRKTIKEARDHEHNTLKEEYINKNGEQNGK